MANLIDTYLTDIRTKILANQNLCKYIYYNSRNPLAQPDIADTKAVLCDDKRNRKIFFTPFSVDTTDETKTTLTVTVDRFKPDSSTYFEDMVIYFTIACNVRLWELNDGTEGIVLRPNGIWDELNKTFKRERTVGLGKNHFQSGYIQKFNDYFWGYNYCLTAKDFPILGQDE